MKACCFGHREQYMQIDNLLKNTVLKLIAEDGVDVFYTGGMGDTDKAFFATVRSSQKKYKNIKLILVKPYFSNELNSNKEYYEDYYDDIIIPDSVIGVHYKSAIQMRNQWMIDNSDFVISCVHRDFGGALKAVKYAERTGKTVISLLKK